MSKVTQLGPAVVEGHKVLVAKNLHRPTNGVIIRFGLGVSTKNRLVVLRGGNNGQAVEFEVGPIAGRAAGQRGRNVDRGTAREACQSRYLLDQGQADPGQLPSRPAWQLSADWPQGVCRAPL